MKHVQKKPFNLDELPYEDFIEFFKGKEAWKQELEKENSLFVRLMTLGDLFFKKKIISQNSETKKSITLDQES